jgi:hypothetical protein
MNESSTLTSDVEAIVQELLKLPVEQRILVGERLLDSVPPVIDEPSMQEYRRRFQELVDGTVEGIPGHEAIERARQELREARNRTS